MEQDEISERWKRIAKALFAAPAPKPSEAFVRRVMARVATLEAPRQPLWSLRWLAPTVAFAAASILLAFAGPRPEAAADLLLEDDGADGYIDAEETP